MTVEYNLGGRPRRYDLDELADKLIEWSKQPQNMTLLDFCNDYEIRASYLSEWAKIDQRFSEALDLAKSQIGARRERLVSYGKLEKGAFNRTQGMYDKLLNEFEREEKEYEYGLKHKNEIARDKGIVINLVEKPWKELNGNDRITE
jgi:hypothetical protein